MLRNAFKWACVLGLLILTLPSSLKAQETPTADETYRLRIENYTFGKVEISTDSGKHYKLLGRVSRPAKSPMVDRSANVAGSILRSTHEFFTFSVALGQSLIVCPVRSSVSKTSKKGGSASAPPTSAIIQTNLPKSHPLFHDFLPPENTRLFLQLTPGFTDKIPETFTLGEEDTFIFTVSLGKEVTKEVVAKECVKLAEAYQAEAAERAKANKTQVVSGMLALQPKLPLGEPDPIVYVTYSIDGDQVAAQNTEPFSYDWDTKQVSNGEHLVEIRALNRQGNLITRARVLVVVTNTH